MEEYTAKVSKWKRADEYSSLLPNSNTNDNESVSRFSFFVKERKRKKNFSVRECLQE